jgi:hypothetical protein
MPESAKVEQFEGTHTLQDLLDRAAVHIPNTESNQLSILCGYPPSVCTLPLDTILSAIPLRNSDTCIIEVGPLRPKPAAAAAATTGPSLPPWCYKGGRVLYKRSNQVATLVRVHPPLPGESEAEAFATIQFADGQERETTLEALGPLNASGGGGGGSGSGGSGNGGALGLSNASGVATDAERAQLLMLGLDEEQLSALGALPAAEQLEMAAAFGLTRIPTALYAADTDGSSGGSGGSGGSGAAMADAGTHMQPTVAMGTDEEHAPGDTPLGRMQRVTVPADNSCLFTSVGCVITSSRLFISDHQISVDFPCSARVVLGCQVLQMVESCAWTIVIEHASLRPARCERADAFDDVTRWRHRYLLQGQKLQLGPQIRELVASVIASDPVSYSAAILAKPPAEYVPPLSSFQ